MTKAWPRPGNAGQLSSRPAALWLEQWSTARTRHDLGATAERRSRPQHRCCGVAFRGRSDAHRARRSIRLAAVDQGDPTSTVGRDEPTGAGVTVDLPFVRDGGAVRKGDRRCPAHRHRRRKGRGGQGSRRTGGAQSAVEGGVRRQDRHLALAAVDLRVRAGDAVGRPDGPDASRCRCGAALSPATPPARARTVERARVTLVTPAQGSSAGTGPGTAPDLRMRRPPPRRHTSHRAKASPLLHAGGHRRLRSPDRTCFPASRHSNPNERRVTGTDGVMRFLQFVPGTATPAKPGKLRTTLVGAALACAVMAAGAGPVSAAVPAEPETRAPEAATAAEPAAATAVATQTAAPAAIPVTLAPGLSGFDNIGADTSAQLSCLSDSGYSFDVIDALGAGWDSEYRSAAALGISVVLFQGFYKPYWTDPTKGTSRGQLMVSNAQLVGYPGGAQVFLNLEDNLSDGASPTTRAGIIQWVQNWAAVVKAAGYTPGVYVGNPQILSADDLTSALTNVSVFWRSASGSAPQSARGYVLRQPSISAAACGTTIDIDTSGSDNLGAGLVGAGFPRGLTAPATSGALGPLTPA